MNINRTNRTEKEKEKHEAMKNKNDVVVYFEVPAEHTGYIIGKKGAIIKNLMKMTGAFVSIVHNPMEVSKDGSSSGSSGEGEGGSAARFVVKGTNETVHSALANIKTNLEKIDQHMVIVSSSR